MKVHYLEIVTSDVNDVCSTYETIHGVSFSTPDPLLGNARTATMADGITVGVRGTLSEEEDHVIRPYWLVEDIDAAHDSLNKQDAQIIHPPLEIPGKGKFAIYSVGGIHQGLWQI